MHGIHDIHEEYKGNAERLGPPIRSVDSFGLARAKGRAVSSRPRGWIALGKEAGKKVLLMALFLCGFWMIFEGLGGVGSVKNLIKIAAFKTAPLSATTMTQHFSKRSEIPDLPVEKSTVPKASPVNDRLHLFVSLLQSPSNSTLLSEALTAIKESEMPTKLVTFTPLNQTFLPESIYYESNSTSLFEALTFAWCRVFKEQKQFPGKITILASKSDEWCVKRTLNKVLKVKDEQFSVKSVEEPSAFQCTAKQDPFDCSNEERLRLRYLKSRHCPELAPILLACRNEITLDRARRFVPRLAIETSESKEE